MDITIEKWLQSIDEAVDEATQDGPLPREMQEELADLLPHIMGALFEAEILPRLIAAGIAPERIATRIAEITRDTLVAETGWEPRRRSISSRVRTTVYRRDGYACTECGQDDITKLTLDHKIPVILGGTNDAANLVTRCRSCNSSKGTEVR